MCIHPLLAALFVTLLTPAPTLAQLPDAYVDEPFLAGLDGPVGVAFDANERAYVLERVGRVFVVENGALLQPPLLDISDEVASWRDHGMLGFALDPDFLSNGYFYTYYTVDRHHLLHAGTPAYDPTANEYFNATVGRVTRFTASAASSFTTTVPASRLVLLGESPDSGVPILFESHGTGSLVVGADGTLLLSSGDAANYGPVDNGSSSGTYWAQALADGIIRPEENVGAFRSQMIGSLSGKILRIDAATGDGLPSNPFFDSAAPRAPRSRVWALGLRNPFRFSVRPGTGHGDPHFGDPGVLAIGDVGWFRWEEMHIISEAGENLGWPLFEGLTSQHPYNNADLFNLDAPNPMYGQTGCDEPYFKFGDLIKQEAFDHNPSFPNPCDALVGIAPGTPTFMHHRPALDWGHADDTARVPIFEGNTAGTSTLGELGCPVEGEPFRGWCAVGGTWLAPVGFGDFAGMFLQMDFSANWMRALRIDANQQLEAVFEFGAVDSPSFVIQDPGDGSVLYTSMRLNEVRRLRFTGTANVAPQPLLASVLDVENGVLSARFDASLSLDPEGGPLSFLWNFGDGTTSIEPSPLHLFLNPGAAPAVSTVTLTVTDEGQLSSQTVADLQLDNSAPQVAITSFANGSTYSTTENTTLLLEATASDAEHALNELSFRWQLFRRHDNHEHPEEVINEQSSSVVLTPTPCGSSFFTYRVELTVTDPLGASSTVQHWLLPDCQINASVSLGTSPPNSPLLPGQPVLLVADVTGLVASVDFRVDGELLGSLLAPPYELSWTPPSSGPYMASALLHSPSGSSASSTGLALEVAIPARIDVIINHETNDAVEHPGGHVQVRNKALDLGAGRTTGLRFSLDVPQGALIVSARLEFTADRPGESPAFFEVSAQAADDAPRMIGHPANLSSRPQTAANATWEVEPWRYSLAAGGRQHTPDLSAILQEVVDRPGWERGNWLLLLLQGSGERFARAQRDAGSRPARLVVEFDRSK